VALLGPPFTVAIGFDPTRPDILQALRAPSPQHWFGTDAIGRDVLTRVIAAARLDLFIALGAVALSASVGIATGTVAVAGPQLVGNAIGRITDVAMAFPLFVVALALAAVFGNSVQSVLLATAIINVPFYVRLTRAELAVRYDAPYVLAARLSGWREARILLRVLLPNCAPALLVQMTVNLGWAMLNGAGLSFLGLGVRPPTAEWGVMIGEGASMMMGGQWWLWCFPGLALSASVLALTVAGERLRDHFDPTRKALVAP
jgi:peptide/nickel transport system permease protein